MIPTPQANGRYSGSSISVFREDQFNANLDYKVSEKNWLAIKFFFSNAPQTLDLSGAALRPAAEDIQDQLRPINYPAGDCVFYVALL